MSKRLRDQNSQHARDRVAERLTLNSSIHFFPPKDNEFPVAGPQMTGSFFNDAGLETRLVFVGR